MSMQANNVWILTGRLTRDPEQRDAGQSKVTSITLAVNQPPKRDAEGKVMHDDKGFAVVPTDFPRIQFWGKFGDSVMTNAKKGRLVCVSGQIRTRKVEKPDGTFNYYQDLWADDIRYLDSNKSKDAGAPADSAPVEEAPPPPATGDSEF